MRNQIHVSDSVTLPAYSNKQLNKGVPGPVGFQSILLERPVTFRDALYSLPCLVVRTETPHLIWREVQASGRGRTVRQNITLPFFMFGPVFLQKEEKKEQSNTND